MTTTDRVLLGLLGALMTAMGILHFVRPEPFVQIIPPQLPEPLLLVYVSGFFEIAGGVGVLLPQTRRAAAWGLILLFLAVFPANIYMALEPVAIDGIVPPRWIAWARLPFQLLFLLWAYRFTKPRGGEASPTPVRDTSAA